MPPMQGGGERREIESPITFSISGRAELSSSSRSHDGAGTRADYQRTGFGSGCLFFSLSLFFLYISSPLSSHLLFSYATNLALDFMHQPFAKAYYMLRWRLYTAPRVDRIVKVPVTLVHAFQIITKYSD